MILMGKQEESELPGVRDGKGEVSSLCEIPEVVQNSDSEARLLPLLVGDTSSCLCGGRDFCAFPKSLFSLLEVTVGRCIKG